MSTDSTAIADIGRAQNAATDSVITNIGYSTVTITGLVEAAQEAADQAAQEAADMAADVAAAGFASAAQSAVTLIVETYMIQIEAAFSSYGSYLDSLYAFADDAEGALASAQIAADNAAGIVSQSEGAGLLQL